MTIILTIFRITISFTKLCFSLNIDVFQILVCLYEADSPYFVVDDDVVAILVAHPIFHRTIYY